MPARDLRGYLAYRGGMTTRPDDCPRCRRPYRPGHVLIGWSPCMRCPDTATAQRGLRGHRTLQCLFCAAEGVEVVRYTPPCVHGAGHPNRA